MTPQLASGGSAGASFRNSEPESIKSFSAGTDTDLAQVAVAEDAGFDSSAAFDHAVVEKLDIVHRRTGKSHLNLAASQLHPAKPTDQHSQFVVVGFGVDCGPNVHQAAGLYAQRAAPRFAVVFQIRARKGRRRRRCPP